MKLLLCEGKDDVSVITALCKAEGIEGLTVEQIDGKNKLKGVLQGLTKRPEFAQKDVERLGILLDADKKPEATWQMLENVIREVFGVTLAERGAFAGAKPAIAGFLVGGSNGSGMLEDLCLAALENKPGFSCLDQYIQCLVAKGAVHSLSSKARFRAWMAAQTDFDFHVGKAAEKGYLPWENGAFDSLRDFLRLCAG